MLCRGIPGIRGVSLFVLAVLPFLAAGCSGEGALVPPSDVLALGPAAPVIQPETQAPWAYPATEPVSGSGGLSVLPEGNVEQPVVAGIGTDTPELVMPRSQAGMAQEPGMPAGTSPEASEQVAFLPRFADPMAAPSWAGGLPAAEKACRKRLERLGAKFRDIPAINSGPGCNIPHPVELTELSGGIRIEPAARLNCQITEAFANWVKHELAPAARIRYFSGVSEIKQLSSYSCRTMNSKPGAPMSEHARGNAIDVGEITLNSGREIDVRKPGFFAFREKSLLNTVRADSCKYFSTVLGPGSDIHHKDHFHFDLRQRKAGYRHCD